MEPVATGHFYLAKKTKPKAMVARDGTFAIQLLVFSHPAHRLTVPWRVTYSGAAAQAWWETSAGTLQPGAVLALSLTRLVIIDGSGRNFGAEMHADVTSLQVLPNQPQQSSKPYTKTSCQIHTA